MLRHKKAERNVPVVKRTGPRTGPARVVADATAGGSAAERALRIVTEIAEAGVGLSLADLSARLDLPKATLHRQCTGLLAQGYLARDVDPLRFVVGPALHKLAFITLNHGHVRALRHRVLAELVAEVQETCNFTTLDGAEVLYLDRVEARWPLRLTLDVGAHVPLHCTASGKLFLAHLPPPQFDELVGRARLTTFTANTLAGAAQLRSECDAIRAAGYSTDREEFIAGLIAVAVPVYDPDNVLRAAIAMHAPTARLALDDALKRLPHLVTAARRMREFL
jgi:IclR family acetate operon transcriptional repressor